MKYQRPEEYENLPSGEPMGWDEVVYNAGKIERESRRGRVSAHVANVRDPLTNIEGFLDSICTISCYYLPKSVSIHNCQFLSGNWTCSGRGPERWFPTIARGESGSASRVVRLPPKQSLSMQPNPLFEGFNGNDGCEGPGYFSRQCTKWKY